MLHVLVLRAPSMSRTTTATLQMQMVHIPSQIKRGERGEGMPVTAPPQHFHVKKEEEKMSGIMSLADMVKGICCHWGWETVRVIFQLHSSFTLSCSQGTISSYIKACFPHSN